MPRLAPTLARLVEFTPTSREHSGQPAKTSPHQVLTLLDHTRYPAEKIAALYAEGGRSQDEAMTDRDGGRHQVEIPSVVDYTYSGEA